MEDHRLLAENSSDVVPQTDVDVSIVWRRHSAATVLQDSRPTLVGRRNQYGPEDPPTVRLLDNAMECPRENAGGIERFAAATGGG